MSRAVHWATLPVLFLVAACATTRPATIAESLDLIRQRALQEHIVYLAGDELAGRMTGEPGYDAAAAYVAAQLGEMGVMPAGTNGWYQPVPLRTYEAIERSAGFVIHGDDGDRAFTCRDDFSMPGDPVATASRVRAEVVYVGHGVHAPEHGYSDYDGIDVRGKIVARYSGAPEIIEGEQRAYYSSSRVKVEEAVARGAVGTITLRSRKAEERRPWDEAKKRVGRRPSMTWVSETGRAAGHHAELRGNVYLAPATASALFANAPLSYEDSLDAIDAGQVASANLGVEVTITLESRHGDLSSPNVVGLVRGTDPLLADEYVVYTAHLDHLGMRKEGDQTLIFNGAYDNAVGIALMLETARAFAAFPPRRSVLFVAVTAEERGLLGSDYFVNHPVVPAGAIVANINLDMPLFLYPVADLVAFGSENSSLQGIAESAARAEGFVFTPDPFPEENLFVRSDQYSFVRQGIPAVFLVPGFTSLDDDVDGEALYRDHIENHYHEASDDLSRPVDWKSAVRFARAHTRIGYAVAMQDARPAWNEGNFFGERFATP